MPLSLSWWISCAKLTVQVDTDATGCILAAAPIVRKFVGQDIGRLVGWMESKFGEVEVVQL
jgi:hypothetical protein